MEKNQLKPVLRIEGDDRSFQINRNYFTDLASYKANTSFINSEEYACAVKNGILPSGHIEGDTLIKSPYDEKYIAIQDYEATVMQDKSNHIAEIARMLGAVYTKCSIQINNVSERNIQGNFAAEVRKIHADFNWQQTEEARLQSLYRANQQFPAAKVPTIDTYNDAVQYAEEHHLENDSGIKILLRSRKPIDDNNLLETQKVSVQLSTELNTNLDIAAHLTERSDIFNFSFDYCRTLRRKKEVTLDIKFYFAIPGRDNMDIINRASQEI